MFLCSYGMCVEESVLTKQQICLKFSNLHVAPSRQKHDI